MSLGAHVNECTHECRWNGFCGSILMTLSSRLESLLPTADAFPSAQGSLVGMGEVLPLMNGNCRYAGFFPYAFPITISLNIECGCMFLSYNYSLISTIRYTVRYIFWTVTFHLLIHIASEASARKAIGE